MFPLSRPCFEYEAAGAVFVVFFFFFLFQDTERLAREVKGGLGGEQVRALARGVLPRVEDVRQFPLAQAVGVEDVAQLLAGQAVQSRVAGVQLGTQERPPLRVPLEGRKRAAAGRDDPRCPDCHYFALSCRWGDDIEYHCSRCGYTRYALPDMEE